MTSINVSSFQCQMGISPHLSIVTANIVTHSVYYFKCFFAFMGKYCLEILHILWICAAAINCLCLFAFYYKQGHGFHMARGSHSDTHASEHVYGNISTRTSRARKQVNRFCTCMGTYQPVFTCWGTRRQAGSYSLLIRLFPIGFLKH